MATTEFSVVYHCEFIIIFLMEFQKRRKVTEVNLCNLVLSTKLIM